MKPQEVISTLRVSLKNHWPILLQSSPGIGKSSIVEQVTKELGYDLMIEHPVISESIDMKGLPNVDQNGHADFIPYGNLLRLCNTEKPLVCFIDDLGNATPSCQASYLHPILAREINGKKISPYVSFVAASNRKSDNSAVQGLISSLLNRFRSVITLEVDADQWIKWGSENGVAIELLAFIQLRPALLSNFDPKLAKNISSFSSPRSLCFLSEWLQAGITDVETWAGAVGEPVATEFAGFFKIYQQMAGLLPNILLNPSKAPLLEKPDEIYSVISGLVYRASEKNIDQIGIYLERIINQEFSLFGWKMMTARNKELSNTSAFQSWSIKHSDEIL